MTDQEARIFLEGQHRRMLQLVAQNPLLEMITPQRFPSREFLVSMLARGLARRDGQILPAYGLNIRIRLNDDYLTRADSREIFEYLGPHEEPWHPNFHGSNIFVPVHPAQDVVDLVRTCFNLWTWRQYSDQDENLNIEVVEWARHQPAADFPVDHRSLVWPPLPCCEIEECSCDA